MKYLVRVTERIARLSSHRYTAAHTRAGTPPQCTHAHTRARAHSQAQAGKHTRTNERRAPEEKAGNDTGYEKGRERERGER